MDLDLKNKNAIVCGSTQGIGEASAIELAKLGANITLIARNESKLLNVLNELDKSQGQIHSFVCIDFSNTEKLKEEVNLLKGNYHILVNNTGGPASGPLVAAKTDSFEDAFRMHLINNQILAQNKQLTVKQHLYLNLATLRFKSILSVAYKTNKRTFTQ